MAASRDLSRVNLNLLVPLDALLREGSVTRAAARLSLTQSAMSHTLARLREQFGDALLVRRGSSMVLTPLGEGLRAKLASALSEVGEIFEQEAPFDPARGERTFHVLASDYAQVAVLPPLLGRLGGRAPGVSWALSSAPNPERLLGDAACDLFLGPMRDEVEGLFRKKLFSDPLVCVARRGHPALEGGLRLEGYLGAGHALVSPRGRPGGLVDDELGRRGLTRRVLFRAPHFLATPFVVAESDMLLTLPRRVALALAPLGPLEIAPLPIDLPPVAFYQAWHARHQGDSGHAWLRAEVAAAVGG